METQSQVPIVETASPGAAPPESSVWADLLDDRESSDDYDWDGGVEPQAASEQTVVPPAIETPQAPPAVAPAPPSPPQASPVGSPQGVQQAPVAPTAPQGPTPESLKRMREGWMEQLAQRYALSDEVAERLVENPREVLPRLAAAVHSQAIQEAFTYGQQMIPRLVQHTIQQNHAYSQAQGAFFSKWPELRGHEAAVAQVAVAYRAANPGASLEDAIDKVGRLASTYLGVQSSAPALAPSAPMAPAMPPRPGATTGRAFQPPQQQVPLNPFTALAESFLREDAATFED